MKTYYICSREWKPGMTLYVSDCLGDGGADWGYTDEPAKAKPISTYWMRRFRKDMERVNAKHVNIRKVA